MIAFPSNRYAVVNSPEGYIMTSFYCYDSSIFDFLEQPLILRAKNPNTFDNELIVISNNINNNKSKSV